MPRIASRPYVLLSHTVGKPSGVVRARRSVLGGLGHLHARLGLVALGGGVAGGHASLDLLVLLDQGAAGALEKKTSVRGAREWGRCGTYPVRHAAVARAVALDAELLADLGALHHYVAGDEPLAA